MAVKLQSIQSKAQNKKNNMYKIGGVEIPTQANIQEIPTGSSVYTSVVNYIIIGIVLLILYKLIKLYTTCKKSQPTIVIRDVEKSEKPTEKSAKGHIIKL